MGISVVVNLTVAPLDGIVEKQFGRSAVYFDVVSQIIPRLTAHRYHFMPNDVFREWIERESIPVERANQVHARELLDNAHLAATTALARTMYWAEAMCIAYQHSNFLSWASAARGLLESSGDIGDGLLNVPPFLAQHHPMLSAALAGAHKSPMDLRAPEQALGHYIRAQWTRDKSGEIPRAKDNVEYVRWIERANVRGIVPLYHKLCGITHPASGSLDYMYVYGEDGLRLEMQQGQIAIESICSEFSDVFPASIMLPCNGALLILRVLHKFGRHPKLPELRKLDWNQIKMWPEIQTMLDR